MDQIRTFVAIPLPPVVIGELGKLINRMKPLARDVKWVQPHSIHLTLKFLGNISAPELEKVFTGMAVALQDQPDSFLLETGGVGAFPNAGKPRVLWVGLTGKGKDRLHALQQRIEAALSDQGFAAEERLFSPHLTVARVKFPGGLDTLMAEYMSYSFPAVEFPVGEVHLMRSDLKPDGAVYTVQKSFQLK